MSKWISLSIALIVCGASTPADADWFGRISRFAVQESVDAPAPLAPAETDPAMPLAPYSMSGYGGAYKADYGYPFVDRCCDTGPAPCAGLWDGYCGATGCGYGWGGLLWRRPCGLSACGVKGAVTCAPCQGKTYGVKGGCEPCGKGCDPCGGGCFGGCRPTLLDWLQARCQFGRGKVCVSEPACKGCGEPACKGCDKDPGWMPGVQSDMDLMPEVPTPEPLDAPPLPEDSAWHLLPGRLPLLPVSFGF